MRKILLNLLTDILDRRGLFLYCLAIGLIAYGYEIFNFNFGIDEELFSTDTSSLLFWWVDIGRWGMAVLNLVLLRFSVVPVVPAFLAVAAISLSFVIASAVWKEPDGVALRIAAPFAVAFPVFAYILSFSLNNFGVAIALVLATAAMYILMQGGIRHLIVISVVLAFAAGIYPSVLLVTFPVFALAMLLDDEPGRRRKWTLFSCYILSALLAIAIYFSVTWAAIALLDREFIYIGSYLNVARLSSEPVAVLQDFLVNVMRYLTGRDPAFIDNQPAFLLLFTLSFGVAVFGAWKNRKYPALTVAIVLLLIVLSPFALAFLAGGELPPRTYVSLPLAVAIVVFLAVKLSGPGMRWVIGLLAFICAVNFAAINNRLAYAEHLSWQADRELAVAILDRAQALDFDFGREAVPVLLMGRPKRAETALFFAQSTMGASFFTWDAGMRERVAGFLNTLGRGKFRPANRAEVAAIVQRSSELPDWPDAGSIARLDDTLVIRFGLMNRGQRILTGLEPK